MADTPDPSTPPNETVFYRPTVEGPGAKIGPYKLLQEIGEGGFGVVYMAEQEHPVRRKVALKIIKPGMDTKEVIARFESERQALALMDHPNIARVLDAGTTTGGRPYFVMELVRGVPITEYCDKNNLNTADRLQLFIVVCRAVQHAHQKGVIHRDIKPSNVMVTLHDGQPVPKVIDFGVAKATSQRLTERTMFTAYGQMIGTPAYMSPEQAEMSGLDIDTRSDIYSLGVLLYELLTGTTPLELTRLKEASYIEMQRIIREEDPPRPSTRISTLGDQQTITATHRRTDPAKLRQILKGDLDLIVMKALEKERGRRYDTANTFAQDIERYLHQEPIIARPPSTLYRLQKFASRNKAAVATASAIAICLLLGTIVSSVLAVQAIRARNRAHENLAIADVERTKADASRQLAETERREAERQRDLAHSLKLAEEKSRQLAEQRQVEAETARASAEQKRQDIERQKTEIDQLNTQLVGSLASQRRTLYASHMMAAEKAWETDNIAYLLEMLDSHRPQSGESDLRGFEWFYWNRRCNSDLRTIKIADSFAPESGFGLTFSSTGSAVESSPDGARLAFLVGSPPPNQQVSRVRIWDLEQGTELPEFTLPAATVRPAGTEGAPGSLVASPDPAGTSGRSLLPLDAQHFAVVTPLREARPAADRTSPASPLARSLPEHYELALYNVESGAALYTLREKTPSGFVAARHAAQFAALVNDHQDESGNPVQVAKIWNAKSGELAATVPLPGGPWTTLAISADGSRLAANSFGIGLAATGQGPRQLTVKVWDVASQREIATLSGYVAYQTDFSPDGKVLIINGTSRDDVQAAGGTGLALAASAFELPSAKRLWSKPISHLGTAAVARPIVSGDGRWITFVRHSLLAHERSLKLIDMATGTVLEPLQGHTSPIIHVAFLPDGRRVRTVGRDASVKTWEIPTPPTNQPDFNFAPNQASVLSPDGARQANVPSRAVNGGDLTLRDASTQAVLWIESIPGMVEQIAFSPHGQYVAASWSPSKADPSKPGQVRIWNAASGKQVRSLPKSTLPRNVAYGRPEQLRLGPDFIFNSSGNEIAVTTVDNAAQPPQFRVQLLDIASGRELLTSEQIAGKPIELDWVPNASRILCEVAPPPPPPRPAGAATKSATTSASSDPVLRALDAKTGRVAWSLSPAPRVRAFTPSGAFMAGANAREVGVWETELGKPIKGILLEQGAGASKLAISPDGNRVVVVRPVGISAAPQQPTLVSLWEFETGTELFKLQGHVDPVVDVAFSPDGKRIATTAGGSADTLLWDADTGQTLLTLPGADSGLSFAADGRQLVATVTNNPFGQMAPVVGAGRRIVIADASSPTPESEAQRLVAMLTRPAGQSLLTRRELTQAVQADTSLTAAARERALELLKDIKRSATAVNNAAFAIVKLKDQPTSAYQRAVDFASEATELEPKTANYWNTRGVANFRTGNFTQARDDLQQSLKLGSDARRPLIPENIAFLAMAEHKLGNRDEAKKHFDRYREIVQRSGSPRRGDWLVYLAEADALFGIQPPTRTVHKEILGWGQPVDPAGDCEFVPTTDSLVIKIPGTLHSLAPANNNFDAPRVLREVEGDFTLQAKVAFPVELKKPLTDRAFTFYSAGFLAWESESHLLRIERDGYFQHAIFTLGSQTPARFNPAPALASHAPLVEYIHNGRDISEPRSTWNSSTPPLKGDATWLRLIRRGQRLQTALSHDGQSWQDGAAVDSKFPRKIQVGVVARNNSATPFEATFSELKLTQP